MSEQHMDDKYWEMVLEMLEAFRNKDPRVAGIEIVINDKGVTITWK